MLPGGSTGSLLIQGPCNLKCIEPLVVGWGARVWRLHANDFRQTKVGKAQAGKAATRYPTLIETAIIRHFAPHDGMAHLRQPNGDRRIIIQDIVRVECSQMNGPVWCGCGSMPGGLCLSQFRTEKCDLKPLSGRCAKQM